MYVRKSGKECQVVVECMVYQVRWKNSNGDRSREADNGQVAQILRWTGQNQEYRERRDDF